MTNQTTALERWKALAKVENKRARQAWGGSGNYYVPPKSAFNSDEQIARDQRDAKIMEMAADGITTRDICKQVGLAETTVNRILRRQRALNQ